MDSYQKNQAYNYRFRYGSGGMYPDIPPYTPMETWTTQGYSDGLRNLSGYKNPDWRKQVARGENASTSLTATEKVRYWDGYVEPYYYRQFRYDGNPSKPDAWNFEAGDFLGVRTTQFEMPDEISQDTLNAVSRVLHKKYTDAVTGFRSGVFLGELQEAIHMIRSPLRTFRQGVDRYLDHVTKTRWIRGRDRRAKTRFVRDSWAEYSFGWAPTLNDIKNGYETLQRAPNWTDVKIRAKGTQSRVTDTGTSLVWTGDGLANLQRTIVKYDSGILYSGAVKARVSSARQAEASLWGFRLDEFVPTVYELIPYSWLVDYFSNLGDVIDAYSTNWVSLSWLTKTTSKTAEKQMKTEFDYKRTKSNLGSRFKYAFGNAATGIVRRKDVSRVRNAAIPMPTLTFRLPGTSTKFLNLAALARFGKRDIPFL